MSSEIVRVLMTELASGAIAGGQRLPNERDLAEHFGVSQPTMRESLRALDAMGLIEVRHGSGVYATGNANQLVDMALRTLVQMEGVRILDVLDIRCILGFASAKAAVENAIEEDLSNVSRAAEALVDLGDLDDVQLIARRVVEFQVAFSRASHNPLLEALEVFLIELLMQLQLTGRSGSLRSWKQYVAGFTEDRLELSAALASRDLERTSEAMRRYLDHQHDVFVADPELANRQLAALNSFDALG